MGLLKHRLFIVGLTLGLVLIGSGAYLNSRSIDGDAPQEASHPESAPSEAVPPSEQARRINQTVYQQQDTLPSVAASSEPSGTLSTLSHGIKLEVDAVGNLVVNSLVKDFFEFYLSSLGEIELPELLARIQLDLRTQLPDQAYQQACDILKNYVDYKIDLAELDAQPGPDWSVLNDKERQLAQLEALRQQRSALAALRERYFTADQNLAFFGEEDAYDAYMLERLTLNSREDLSGDAREQALAALEKSLPEDVQAQRRRVTLPGDVYDRARTMQAKGASDTEIFEMRRETLGEDAAQALAELDQQRKQWRQRLDDYVRERNAIRDSGMSEADQAHAIASLIDQRFQEGERLRVKALDASL
ncbi:MAG: hypothetical protein IPM37_08150 [Hahellaceae bacterium]|nr:hypothetical protein [Hahellaceae bacterium]